MPCNMPARGDSLKLIEAGGRSLGELIDEALEIARRVPYAKIAGLLDIEGEACEMALLLDSGRVVAACLECGSTKRGREALKELASRASQVVGRGYLEVTELTRDAVELDLEFEPQAKLPEPLEMLGLSHQEAKPPPSEAQLTAKEAKTSETAKPVGDHDKIVTVTTLVEAEDDSSESTELANILIYMVSTSSIVDFGEDSPRDLLQKAREISLGDDEAFYRAVIELADGNIYNVFYKNGRLCRVVLFDAQKMKARFLDRLEEEEVLAEILREKPVRLYLYRVTCPECEEVLLKGCTGKIPQKGGETLVVEHQKQAVLASAGQAGETGNSTSKDEKAERPGLLRRLFDRWTG